MSEIDAASITAFYLFDVAEAIDLATVPAVLRTAVVPARLAPKPPTPAYVQYLLPPLVIDGETLSLGERDGFHVRFKLYDYGVISVALVRPYRGRWTDLIAESNTLIDNESLEQHAERCCRLLADRLQPALRGSRPKYLTEDYLVFAIAALDRTITADELLAGYGEEIALLLRGERQALSRQERDEVLRHRLSYLADDLVIPTWNTAFVFDTEAGVQSALELIEFANSQLLEFRYYDELLDQQMGQIYAELQRPGWYVPLTSPRHARAARQLHSLFIEVNELTDKAENALKMVGDVYAARLFSLVALRIGLDQWKRNVQEKLKTLDDIYRFTVEQTGISRGHVLELTIVFILILELVLFFAGIMQ